MVRFLHASEQDLMVGLMNLLSLSSLLSPPKDTQSQAKKTRYQIKQHMLMLMLPTETIIKPDDHERRVNAESTQRRRRQERKIKHVNMKVWRALIGGDGTVS